MARNLREFPCDSTIHILDDIKVCREEDIEVALVDLPKENSQIGSLLRRNYAHTKGVDTGTVCR